MPLVRIDMIAGRSAREVAAIGQAVHQALVDCMGVPARDHFQVITEHARSHLVFDPQYLETQRTEGIVLVQVFLSSGRDQAQKNAFLVSGAVYFMGEKVEPLWLPSQNGCPLLRPQLHHQYSLPASTATP